MQHKKVSQRLKNYNEIAVLYKTAFPKKERLPLWLLEILSRRKCADFFAFYDKEQFCGIIYLIHYEDLTFVFYLAINSTVRSKGYGSEILHWLEEYKPDSNVVLCIEPIVESDNYDQRVKRLAFYKRNGFSQTGYQVIDGGRLDILHRGRAFSPKKFDALIRHFAFGILTKPIVKADPSNIPAD